MKTFLKKNFPELVFIKNVLSDPIKNYKYMKEKKNNLIILVYHRIMDLEYDPFNVGISPEDFEKQIKYISENYDVITFGDSWRNIKKKSVIITFDDGYVDNYNNALPILEKYKVPATFFISTGNLGTYNEYWDLDFIRMIKYRQNNMLILDGKKYILKNNEEQMIREIHLKLYSTNEIRRKELLKKIEQQLNPKIKYKPLYRCMNKEELKKLSESKYVTIGAHTVNHVRLFMEDYQKQYEEIRKSKEILELITKKTIKYFAYPFGKNRGRYLDYSNETIEILKEIGFEKAVTVGNLSVKYDYDNFQIPRISVNKIWAKYSFAEMLKFYRFFR